jgi:hypothetical protein
MILCALPQAAEWLDEASFWLAFAALLTLAATAAGVFALLAVAREVREGLRRLDGLAEIDHKVGRLVADRDDLDLRRIEHLLLDLRDTQQRLEDALLRTVEQSRGASADAQALVVPPRPESVGERVVNRMLALGYAQVEIITRHEKLAEVAQQGGEVLVEAKREGVLHKGRVIFRSGRLTEVEMRPGYAIFP